ncbi:hypothetical protein KY334_00555 [Candidatus Woesearchaeota archaeon]|nr:hypothetical protein [Candidatus Woesearchaeota archaeon]
MDKIKAKIILEIAGYPEKHVEETMKKVIEKIETTDKYTLEDKEIFPVEEKDETFATFSELTITFENIVDVYEFCFNFMPSSIDIIEPEDSITIKPDEFNNGINDLIATIHHQDMFLKNSNANLKKINDNLNKLLLNFVAYLHKDGKTIPEMQRFIGISEERIKEFIKTFKKNDKQ